MNSFRTVVDKLDDAVLAVERVLLLATLSLMTLLVSLDVVQRTFSRPVKSAPPRLR
jgi:TRAP-type C4-dicarboxylate transport system permease small subunit